MLYANSYVRQEYWTRDNRTRHYSPQKKAPLKLNEAFEFVQSRMFPVGLFIAAIFTCIILDRKKRGTCDAIVFAAFDERDALGAAAGFANLIDAKTN